MKRPTRITGVLILGATLWLAPAETSAQAAGETTAQAPSLGEVRDRVEARYQVLPIRDGIVLMPQYGSAEVQSIELADGTIAVNGQPVTGAELRDLVGDDAADVTRLSYMDPASRRVLFGIGPPPAAEPADTAAATGDEAPAEAAAPPDVADEPDGRGLEDVPFDIDIDSDDSRVAIGSSVEVRADERVDGDVVAVLGSARVDGMVGGDVVAVMGSVTLGPSAVVDGEVVSVGGRVDRAPGARVDGGVNEVAWMGPTHIGFHPEFDFFRGVGGVIGTVVFIAVLGLLVALAYLLAGRPIERMEYRVATSPWKAVAVGLLAQILFVPALVLTCVILAISIVGIPLLLAVPLAIVALFFGVLAGFAAVAKYVGHDAERRFGWDHRNPYISILVGLGLIMALTFFGKVLGMVGGPLDLFATVLVVIGFVIQYVAWTTGAGALLLTRFGTRHGWGEGEEPGAPPPPAAAPATGEVAPPPPPEGPAGA